MSYEEMLRNYMFHLRKNKEEYENRRRKMNVWETVIDYMNEHVGEIGSRQGLIHHVKARVDRQFNLDYRQFNTVDCYKNYMVQAGLIHKIRMDGKNLQGKFFIPKQIPIGMSTQEVRQMAYGPKLMMIGVDRSITNPCASAGHYYIGGISGNNSYVLKEDTTNYADTKPREPEFLSKDDFKI